MARLYSQEQFGREALQEKIEALFGGTPLSGLITSFQTLLQTTSSDPGPQDIGIRALTGYINFLQRLFDNSFHDRFFVDSWLIRDTLDGWNGTGALMQNVVPVYAQEWSYTLLLPPEIDKVPLFEMYVVTFPGRDALREVDILHYPWLCHELGHHVLAKSGRTFKIPMLREVEQFATSLSRKSISDSPHVKQKQRALAEQARRFWKPTPQQYDWSQEIAVDVIALWTCGPAYLAAFHDAVENSNVDPFLLSEGHPPYDVRVRVMIELADELGWAEEVDHLRALRKSWKTGKWSAKRNNEYVAYTENGLVEKSAQIAHDACLAWDLPQCSNDLVGAVEEKYRSNQSFDQAIEVFLSAWLSYKNAPGGFSAWQTATIQRLSEEIRP